MFVKPKGGGGPCEVWGRVVNDGPTRRGMTA